MRRRQWLMLCWGACFIAALTGCPSSSPQPTPPSQDSSEASTANPAPTRPHVDPTTLYKPEYTLTIESSGEPARYTVKWTARVNTGGWTMETDVARVENSMDKNEARIYVILTQPDPNDMVTQAFETLEGSFDAGETEVHKAELSVKHRAANDDPSFMRYYTVVKRAP